MSRSGVSDPFRHDVLFELDHGTVALAEAWARWTHTLGQVSDDESQFSERVGQTEG